MHPSPKEKSIAKWHSFLDQFPSINFFISCLLLKYLQFLCPCISNHYKWNYIFSPWKWNRHLCIAVIFTAYLFQRDDCLCVKLFFVHFVFPQCYLWKQHQSAQAVSILVVLTYTTCVVLHGICHIVVKNRIVVVCSVPQLKTWYM